MLSVKHADDVVVNIIFVCDSFFIFFVKQKTAYEMRISDWSSDVCSSDLNAMREVIPAYYSVKEAIFPFLKFQNVDPILGPEMRSTGEVMGVGRSFGAAFARGHEAAGIKAPMAGKAFLSVRDGDKERLLPVAREIIARGFNLVATSGTASYLAEHGVTCERINKVLEGRPHIVDLIKTGETVYTVKTTEGKQAIADSFSIRR